MKRAAVTVIPLIWTSCVFAAVAPGGLDAGDEAPPRYRVRVRGVSERRLGVAFEHILNSMALRDRPPPDIAMLERRALADVPRLRRALEARGYFAAEIEAAVETEGRRRPYVVFHVRRGARYRLGTVDLAVGDPGVPPDERPPPLPEALRERLRDGVPAAAADILAAENACIRFYLENGHPFARWTERVYWPDHANRLLHGRLRIAAGPRAGFGPTAIEGHTGVREPYLRRLVPWKEGETFSAAAIETAQRNFTRGGMFATVVIAADETLDAHGNLPVTIALRERPHRTVGVGARYRTDEGAGGGVEWMHRNLAGAGEQARIAIDGFATRVSMSAEARKPAFKRHDQQLIGVLTVEDERPDAYASRRALAALRIEREPRRFLRWSLGGSLKTARVRQAGVTERVTLAGMPWRTVYDTREDALDPSRGSRLDMEITPMVGLPDAGLMFLKLRPEIGAVHQLPAPAPRLAVRMRALMILGATHGDVPADERAYVGGGGSVRGYAYQSLGPRKGDRPEGGLSALENAIELRWRFSERWGFCAFADAGQAYRERIPLFSGWSWGAGIGVRYYPPRIGPIRADIAVPLARRHAGGDAFQFYLSLGQAF